MQHRNSSHVALWRYLWLSTKGLFRVLFVFYFYLLFFRRNTTHMEGSPFT